MQRAHSNFLFIRGYARMSARLLNWMPANREPFNTTPWQCFISNWRRKENDGVI